MTMLGAEILLITSAFDTVSQMRRYLSALAIQNQCYVIGINDVRTDKSPYRGYSCICDQFGEVIAGVDEGVEEILYCEVDTSKNRRDNTPHLKELDATTFDKLAVVSKEWIEKQNDN